MNFCPKESGTPRKIALCKEVNLLVKERMSSKLGRISNFSFRLSAASVDEHKRKGIIFRNTVVAIF